MWTLEKPGQTFRLKSNKTLNENFFHEVDLYKFRANKELNLFTFNSQVKNSADSGQFNLERVL